MAMTEQAKFLIELADQFGKDAQAVLDFITKDGNIEKATKALKNTDNNTDKDCKTTEL